jgi:lipopolysaccharide/colanic/teichoic acid biosynthesis glycosyltransferase
MAEHTPFLAREDDGDDYEHHPIKISPANSHFKRPLTVLTALISFLSLAIFALLIASYVLVSTGPFIYTWSSKEAIRDLAIVVSTSVVLLLHYD